MRTTDTRGGAMARVKLARDVFGRAYVCKASYRLVFTQPALGNSDNFMLLPAESQKLHKSMDHFRRGFIRNAVNIFDRHNINVPRDTTEILPKTVAIMAQ